MFETLSHKFALGLLHHHDLKCATPFYTPPVPVGTVHLCHAGMNADRARHRLLGLDDVICANVPSAAGSIGSIYGLVQFWSSPIIGGLSDLRGFRYVFQLCLLLWYRSLYITLHFVR